MCDSLSKVFLPHVKQELREGSPVPSVVSLASDTKRALMEYSWNEWLREHMDK